MKNIFRLIPDGVLADVETDTIHMIFFITLLIFHRMDEVTLRIIALIISPFSNAKLAS